MTTSAGTLTRAVLVVGGLGYLLVLITALLVLHLAPDVVLALTLGSIALVVIALRPYVGAQAFLFLLFFENVLEARQGFTPMKVLGAIILGGWLLSLMTRRQAALRMTVLALTLMAYVAWNCICLMYAIDVSAGVTKVFTFTQLALAALMFASVVNTRDRLHGALAAFVLWTFVSTLIAIAQYYAGQTPMAMGLVGNRNLLALYIDIAIVCAYLLHQVTRDGLRRAALLATLPVFFLGLALTFSRGGLISAAVVILLVSWRVVRRRNLLVPLGSAAVICLMTFVFPSEFFERAQTIVPALQLERKKDTFGARVRLWRVAARMTQDRPIVGVGPASFIAAYPRYARGGEIHLRGLVTHNAYLAVAAESGIPGLLLFLSCCGLALVEAQRTSRRAREAGRPDFEMLAVAVEVSLIAILITSLSGNTEGLKVLWMTLGIAAGLRGLRDTCVSIPPRAVDPPAFAVVPSAVGAGTGGVVS